MNTELALTALVHALYGRLRHVADWMLDARDTDRARGDEGATSLEQVLWFVAAGVAVAVIAAILWGKIKNEANKPVNPPSAP